MTDWDSYGQLVTALMLMALIAYLAPGMGILPPAWERRFQIAAIALLAAALLLAVIATIIWFAA
jgi:hypothetical protein